MAEPISAALPELTRIGLALALGLLVGIQRGWALRNEVDGARFAGIRTFGLIGLAGGFSGAFVAKAPVLSAVTLAGTAGLILLGYWRQTRTGILVSGTASLVGLLTLACGYLAGSGDTATATVATGIMVMVLALRRQLHGWIAGLNETEIVAIGRFALLALVILPLLPDTPFGPFGAWRLRQLWLVVVLVSGFSLAGYLAARRFGERRGVLATAAAGSVVSSTAVTTSLAGKLKTGHGDPAVLNAGIALGSVIMFLRVMVLCALLAPAALQALAVYCLPGMLVSLVAALWLMRGAKPDGGGPSHVELRNPFDLSPALLLATMVMALTLVAHWVLAHYGDRELAVVLAITGMVDVDSAIITLGNLPAGALDPNIAGLVLAPPILLNTLLKAGISATLPGARKGWPGAIALVLSALAAGLALPFLI